MHSTSCKHLLGTGVHINFTCRMLGHYAAVVSYMTMILGLLTPLPMVWILQKTRKLPPTWKYESSTASALVS